jgi:hypothetical protein
MVPEIRRRRKVIITRDKHWLGMMARISMVRRDNAKATINTFIPQECRPSVRLATQRVLLPTKCGMVLPFWYAIPLRICTARLAALQSPHACIDPPPRSRSRQETWRIYYGDVPAGSIAQSVGNPGAAPKWEWRCGFYPGSQPGECTGGTAASFDEARATFEAAWRVFLAKRTEANFQALRDQRDWTAEKYRCFDRGERMPHDWRPGG